MTQIENKLGKMNKNLLKELINKLGAREKYYIRSKCGDRPFYNLLKSHYIQIIISYYMENGINTNGEYPNNNTLSGTDIRNININTMKVEQLRILCRRYPDIKTKIFLVNNRKKDMYKGTQFMRLRQEDYITLISMYIDKIYNDMSNVELDNKYYN